ncbi:MAG: glycerol-3-phosphate dehydrogenase [Limisphaerales bacterium]|nr:MAG: glycerol-3-phosphate dehydrogenase [Limisphaerales bacterium]KAG0509948.1 MAG: glycerol-3-phosphate dehydrogenase [Limisphaerales bacterium]TXT45377.1 MAG: glycerol-3-phosphate dehydrogenase [Limisphaerales bacterium]
MNRASALAALLEQPTLWDVLVIGGGATGLGVAVDAAARGLRTALVDRSDFAKGTSSRSTKLIHGGFRYLKQGNIALVRESLHERGLLLRNAPHLVHPLDFVVPCYHWWEAPYYGVGLKLYDWFAGDLGLEPSRHLSVEQAGVAVPNVRSAGLRGGIHYQDGQFDDSRLAISLAQTATDLGASVANYVRVVSLLKKDGRVAGARVCDAESGKEFPLHARAVINATGVFTDAVRRMDEADAPPVIAASQGAHLVLPRHFLGGDTALMVPRTDDGRVLFVIPWQDRVLVGTTDTPVVETPLEPRPLTSEIQFLLEHAAQYLAKAPTASDILSVTAGLRPLVKLPGAKSTAALPRDHIVLVSGSGLVSITGGKWTTYRKMAANAVGKALEVASLPRKPCATENLPLADTRPRSGLSAAETVMVPGGQASPARRLHPDLPLTADDVLHAARHEMARTVEDVLSRRSRCLLLDARAAAEAAPAVAALLTREFGRGAVWEAEQVAVFRELAKGYLPP